MAQLLIKSLGCPNCGAPYEPGKRSCRFCGSVLIVTSLSESFHRDLDAHQVAESVAKWRQRLKEDAGSAEAHFALGLSYLNLKLRDAALEHLRKAVLLAPEVTDAHFNLALTLFNDGNIPVASPDYVEAMKEIDYSARLSPDFREAVGFNHFFHARRLDMVDNAQAQAEYAKAIGVCSDIATFHNNLGLCFLRSKKLIEARACYQRAIELDPNFALAYSNLCQVMFEEKDYAKGIEVGMKAVSMMGPATLAESQACAHNNLALCLWQSQRQPEALEHINKALALAPSNNLFQQNAKLISQVTSWRQKFKVCAAIFFGAVFAVAVIARIEGVQIPGIQKLFATSFTKPPAPTTQKISSRPPAPTIPHVPNSRLVNPEEQAKKCAETLVLKNIKTPSTASFAERQILFKDHPRYQIYILVDAENSFGARIRSGFVCTLKVGEGDTFTYTPGAGIQEMDEQFIKLEGVLEGLRSASNWPEPKSETPPK